MVAWLKADEAGAPYPKTKWTVFLIDKASQRLGGSYDLPFSAPSQVRNSFMASK
jgi:hypothetical protein